MNKLANSYLIMIFVERKESKLCCLVQAASNLMQATLNLDYRTGHVEWCYGKLTNSQRLELIDDLKVMKEQEIIRHYFFSCLSVVLWPTHCFKPASQKAKKAS